MTNKTDEFYKTWMYYNSGNYETINNIMKTISKDDYASIKFIYSITDEIKFIEFMVCNYNCKVYKIGYDTYLTYAPKTKNLEHIGVDVSYQFNNTNLQNKDTMTQGSLVNRVYTTCITYMRKLIGY